MKKSKITAERKRLNGILERAEVPAQVQDLLKPVVENMAWQRVKLDETLAEMQEASVICTYDNGGGQIGIRENPIFKGYVNLWRAYMLGLEKFSSYLPKEMQEEQQEAGQNVLDLVKRMKEAQ